MDGNGRWAAQRHLPRVEGHRAGIAAVRETVETSARLGIPVITLYAFSVENWKRPRTEVERADGAAAALPALRARRRCSSTTSASASSGARDALAPEIQRELHDAEARTAAQHRHAVQHRAELRRPGRDRRRGRARALAARASQPDEIDEARFAGLLYTAGQPDPDLLIRTSGEMRVSNFLLWQIAYAEIWVTDTLWPDFRARHLLEAIVDYQKRERRYGGVGAAGESGPRRRGAQGGSRQPSVTRVLSALVLLPIVIGIVWVLPPVDRRSSSASSRCSPSSSTRRWRGSLSPGFPRAIAGVGTARHLHGGVGRRAARAACWRRRCWWPRRSAIGRGRADEDALRLVARDAVPARATSAMPLGTGRVAGTRIGGPLALLMPFLVDGRQRLRAVLRRPHVRPHARSRRRSARRRRSRARSAGSSSAPRSRRRSDACR